MSPRFEVQKNVKYILFKPASKKILTSNCIYFYKQKVLVDPGNPVVTPDLILNMREHGIDPLEVRYILCTHLHIDHIGAYWLFPNATVFASDEEIECFLGHVKYFAVENYFYSETIKQSLARGLKLLTEHPYERALIPMSKVMEKLCSKDQLSAGKNGYYVFPSHTPGSSIIVFERTVLSGDVFSMEKALEWVPRKFKDKIDLLHTVMAYGKENIIPGHPQITANMVKQADFKNTPLMFQTARRGGKMDNVGIHFNCDHSGRIISEYYFEKSGGRTVHRDGFAMRKLYYNQIGKVHREVYFNSDGNAVANIDGRYGAQFNYDENGRWVLRLDLDNNNQLRRDDAGNYFASVYYYSSSSANQLTARVDFRNGIISGVKYLVDDYVVEPEEADERYTDLISKLEENLLF